MRYEEDALGFHFPTVKCLEMPANEWLGKGLGATRPMEKTVMRVKIH